MHLTKPCLVVFLLFIFVAIYAQAQCPTGPTSTAVSVSPGNPLTDQTVVATTVVSPAAAVAFFGPNQSGVILSYFNEADPEDTYATANTTYSAPSTWTATLPKLPAGTYYVEADYLAPAEYLCLDPSTGSTSFTVVQLGGPAGAALSGHYAFELKGALNAQGISTRGTAAVGSITANGEGKITAGTEDFNSVVGPFRSLPVTGTYSLDTTGIGTLKLDSILGTQTFALYVPAGQAAGSVRTAQLIETDLSFVASHGMLAMQVPSAFTTAAIAGSYAFGERGETFALEGATSPIFVAGEVALTAAGEVTATFTAATAGGPSATVKTAGSITKPATHTGRFTLTLSQSSGLMGGHFVGYVVDPSHFFVMSSDIPADSPLISGAATKQ